MKFLIACNKHFDYNYLVIILDALIEKVEIDTIKRILNYAKFKLCHENAKECFDAIKLGISIEMIEQALEEEFSVERKEICSPGEWALAKIKCLIPKKQEAIKLANERQNEIEKMFKVRQKLNSKQYENFVMYFQAYATNEYWEGCFIGEDKKTIDPYLNEEIINACLKEGNGDPRRLLVFDYATLRTLSKEQIEFLTQCCRNFDYAYLLKIQWALKHDITIKDIKRILKYAIEFKLHACCSIVLFVALASKVPIELIEKVLKEEFNNKPKGVCLPGEVAEKKAIVLMYIALEREYIQYHFRE